MDRRNFGFMEMLKRYWTIWTTIFGAIVLIVGIYYRINAMSESVKEHHTIDDARDGVLVNRVTIVEQNYLSIDKRLDRIERKIDNLK
jgi:hypothetical protein